MPVAGRNRCWWVLCKCVRNWYWALGTEYLVLIDISALQQRVLYGLPRAEREGCGGSLSIGCACASKAAQNRHTLNLETNLKMLCFFIFIFVIHGTYLVWREMWQYTFVVPEESSVRMPKDVSLSVFSVGWAGELATQCAWRPPPPPSPPPSPPPPCCSPSPPSPSCWSLQRQAPILTSRGSDGETATSTFTLRWLQKEFLYEAVHSQVNIFWDPYITSFSWFQNTNGHHDHWSSCRTRQMRIVK